MKVEKIDIKKELMEIPNGRSSMDFIVFDSPLGNYTEIKPEESVATTLSPNQKIERYIVRRLRNGDKPYKDMLIKVGEIGLFEELIQIGNDQLNEIVAKKTESILRTSERKYELLLKKKISEIKKLPWWKRLFNKF